MFVFLFHQFILELMERLLTEHRDLVPMVAFDPPPPPTPIWTAEPSHTVAVGRRPEILRMLIFFLAGSCTPSFVFAVRRIAEDVRREVEVIQMFRVLSIRDAEAGGRRRKNPRDPRKRRD